MTRRGYSAEQVRAAEAPHLAAGEPLMERAATALADQLRVLLPRAGARVLLLIGSGDNGGDALFAGAQLAAEGVAVSIVSTGARIHEAGLAAAVGAGAVMATHARAGELAASAHVVVDGILGIGVTGSPALRGDARAVVLAVLRALERDEPARTVAVDLPSGVGPDDGAVPDVVVLRADLTVTFGALKAGLLLEPGASFAGEVVVADIGLSREYAAMTPLIERPDAPVRRRPPTDRPPRSRLARRMTLVTNIVCAIAVTVLVAAVVYVLANNAAVSEYGSTVTEVFRSVGPGFTIESLDAAWIIFAASAAVAAFSGFAGLFSRHWSGRWVSAVVVLLFGALLSAVVFVGASLLSSGFETILIPVPIVAILVAVVWLTTLPGLRAAGPDDRAATERRLQRRIDVAVGIGSLVIFVGPLLLVAITALVPRG